MPSRPAARRQAPCRPSSCAVTSRCASRCGRAMSGRASSRGSTRTSRTPPPSSAKARSRASSACTPRWRAAMPSGRCGRPTTTWRWRARPWRVCWRRTCRSTLQPGCSWPAASSPSTRSSPARWRITPGLPGSRRSEAGPRRPYGWRKPRGCPRWRRFGMRELHTDDLTLVSPTWAVGVAATVTLFDGMQRGHRVGAARSQETEG